MQPAIAGCNRPAWAEVHLQQPNKIQGYSVVTCLPAFVIASLISRCTGAVPILYLYRSILGISYPGQPCRKIGRIVWCHAALGPVQFACLPLHATTAVKGCGGMHDCWDGHVKKIHAQDEKITKVACVFRLLFCGHHIDAQQHTQRCRRLGVSTYLIRRSTSRYRSNRLCCDAARCFDCRTHEPPWHTKLTLI